MGIRGGAMNVHAITRFTFEAAEFDSSTFSVLKFEGIEELSRPFDFRIDLISSQPEVDLKRLIARNATLSITCAHRTRTIHGVVAEVEAGDEIIDGRFHYRVRFVPRIWLKRLSRHNQIHQAMSVVDVLRRELTGTNGQGVKDKSAQHLQEGRDFEFRLDDTYAPREYIVQWNETDLDFFHRLLETNGLFYYFDHTGGCDKLVICDWKMFLPAHRENDHFHFRNRRDQAIGDELVIERFNTLLRAVPQKVVFADYDDRKPHLTVQAEAGINKPGIGVYTYYGEYSPTLEEIKADAQVAAAVWSARAEVFEGTGTCHTMEPGHCFVLDGHFRRGFNGHYRVVRLRHTGTTETAGASDLRNQAGRRSRYINEFECIADGVEFHLERLTPRPRIDGVISAEIDAEGGGGIAEVDEHGRYKVRFFFDLSGAADGRASCWMRLATPFGGPNEGMHYPLRKGTEVVVSFLNGDPDRPVIIGVVPNPRTPSVVNRDNRATYVTKTPGGVTLVIGNTLGEEPVETGLQQQGHADLGQDPGPVFPVNPAADPVADTPLPPGLAHTASAAMMPPAQQLLQDDDAPAHGPSASTATTYSATLVEANDTIKGYWRLGDTAKNYDEASEGPFYKAETDKTYVDEEDAASYQSHLYVSKGALTVIEGKNKQIVRGEDKHITKNSKGQVVKFTANAASAVGDYSFTASRTMDVSVAANTKLEASASAVSKLSVGTASTVFLGTKMDVSAASGVSATFGYKIDYSKVGTHKLSGGSTYEVSQSFNNFTTDGVSIGLMDPPAAQSMAGKVVAVTGSILGAAAATGLSFADAFTADTEKDLEKQIIGTSDAFNLAANSANVALNIAGIVGYYTNKARVEAAKATKQTLFEIGRVAPAGSQTTLRTLLQGCELTMTDNAAGGEASLRVGTCELKVTPTAVTIAFGGVEVFSVGREDFKYLAGGDQANSITVGRGTCEISTASGMQIKTGGVANFDSTTPPGHLVLMSSAPGTQVTLNGTAIGAMLS